MNIEKDNFILYDLFYKRMVKSIQTKAYECEVCGNKFFEKDVAEKHEKSPEKPRFELNEEVKGHYIIGKVNWKEYAITTFKILDIKKGKHSFLYILEPIYIETYHESGCYSTPFIRKKNSEWIGIHEEDKKLIKSLERKLNEKIVLSERHLSHQIYLKTSAKKDA